MVVPDLHHYLDLPDDVPGPARRLAEQLATSFERQQPAMPTSPGTARCHAAADREPPLPGRIVLQTEPPAPIRWQCSVCDDEGVISNWADSPFDLRRQRLTPADHANEIAISEDVAAALRELRLLDGDCERLVFRIRAHGDGAILPATDDDLDELIRGMVARGTEPTNAPIVARMLRHLDR
jgi:hypothetical protein